MSKQMFRGVVIGVLVALGGVGESVAAEYANDFSVRTSEERRMNDWLAMPYSRGPVAYTYDETKFWPALPYNDSSKVQDGWVKARLNKGGAAADVEVVGMNNPYLRFTTTGNVEAQSALHLFGNEFSNGVLRIRGDMRASGNWTTQGDGRIYLAPLCKKYVNPNAWTTGGFTPSFWGFQAEGWYTWGYMLTGDAWNNAIANFFPSGSRTDRVQFTYGNWYRFVTDIDLDNGQITCSVYNQGGAQPTFDGANGSLIGTIGPTRLYRLVTDETGPVVGVVLHTQKYTGANPVDDSKSPAFDNLAAAWKAPGKSSFESCYENDFAERRSRKLVADEKSYQYVRGDELGGLTFTSYPTPVPKANAGVTPILRNSLGYQHRTEVPPKGIDGWRRLNVDGNGDLHVVSGDAGDAGGAMLRASKGWNFVIGANSFGQKVTSGKVRFSGDIRVPSSWTWMANTGFYLGGESFYTAGSDNISSSAACMFGFGGETSPQTLKPRASDATDIVYADAIDGWTTWYRFVVTADVDAKTYDVVLFRGTGNSPNYDWAPTTADQVCVFKALPFKSTFADDGLCSFGVSSYGHNAVNVPDSNVYFDNIRVWKNVGTPQEKEIYRNLFSERTIWPDADSGTGTVLSDAFNADNGQDHWIRRNNGDGNCILTAGENPCVAADAFNGYVRAVQSLGWHFNQEDVFAQVDVRPPERWVWTAARAMAVEFGNDTYWQGNYYSGSPYTAARTLAVGFRDETAAKDETGFFNDVGLYAEVGNGVGGSTTRSLETKAVPGHWYRFKLAFNRLLGMCSLTVYDQGADHPTADATDGMLVKEVSGLPFISQPEGGISAVGLYATGNANGASSVEDSERALFDNLKVHEAPRGTCVIFR